ncbi:hypothetical protein Nepgr_011645 [Nepenthes gracilis]|uniref:Pentatricopeptide repeat-containing protein n=1 Tax=Nepenthes gracilis TaxID=150966 RepID=A0AAD3SF80_NEPGR|nr:hypothetical protein Nepgr_011645 [Nepenthes gracilis]
MIIRKGFSSFTQMVRLNAGRCESKAGHTTLRYVHKTNMASIVDAYSGHSKITLAHKGRDKEDVVLVTKRILNLSLRGEVDCARAIFEGMTFKDIVAWNVMIKGYIENRRMDNARELFDKMPERDSGSWNAMIVGYMQERLIHIALKLFIVMPGKDVISWTAIITGLFRASFVCDACRLFRQMPERNSISWASIMSGFERNGFPMETLCLFKEMLLAGVEPNAHAFTSALAAAAGLSVLSSSKQLYSQLIKRGLEDNIHIGNSSIAMFIKCGSCDDAKRVFADLPHRNIVTWNSMINGFGQHGYGLMAILIFHKMQNAQISPDRISFLGVLQGCSHCGFVNEGKQYFHIMVNDYGILPGPEHYACMVDLLARAGKLEEAYRIIVTMPFEATPVFWRALLNGCRIWGDMDLGAYAADFILKLEPTNSSACLMLTNIYASAGRWGELYSIGKRLSRQEATKDLGCSWVETKGIIKLFTSRDETHLESDQIYQTVKLLSHDIVEYAGA